MAAALAMFLASLSVSGEESFDFYIEPEELEDPELAEAFSILCAAFPNTGEARAADSTPENSDQASTTPVETTSSDNPSDFRTTSRDCKMADSWGLNDNAGDGWGTSDAAGGGDPWERNGGGGGGGGADDGGDRNCFNCGQPGHNKSDCTEPPKPFEGTCKGCGQEGHMRRECPDAPPMTCRICNEPGHMRKDCPQKPPELCRNCHEEGHAVVDCKNPRKIDTSKIEDIDASTAWTQITEAASEREGFEVKEAIQKYLKHFPKMTYCELEESFRSQQMSIYLIATERALAPTHTNMDLQGNLDKKYTVQYRFSPKPERAREKASWPASPEENFARLADAGEPVSRLMQKCTNCNELGHVSKSCPQDAIEKVRVTITCYNCGEEGHRVRDCPTPRVDKFACKNCGQSGHKVADCTEPRSAEGVECNKCHEMGHFSRDCPQGGGGRACHNCGGEGHISKECTEPRKIKCRNCDEEGHTARDCSKPEDITRVKCMNCGEMGHKKVKCPNAFKEDTDDFGAPDNNNITAGGDDGGWGAGGGGATQNDGGDSWGAGGGEGVTYAADTSGW